MALYTLSGEPPLHEPALVLALSGWVDAGSVGTGAAEHMAGDATVLAGFDGDTLFDYRANRPVLTFTDGTLEEVAWPSLEVRHTRIDDRDLLVMTGSEPDFRWHELADSTVELCRRLGVAKLVTLGGVPAAVPHTLPTPVLTTASDRELLGEEDHLLSGTLVVPGAAVSILTAALDDAGVPTVGYWAQVPHYLTQRFYGGILALVSRAAVQLGVTVPVDDLIQAASEQRTKLDAIVAGREEAQAYVERLEAVAGDGSLPTADEIGAEVERFLRETTNDGDNPFPP